VTCSAGVAEYPLDAADLHALQAAADKALYRAKESGRNRIMMADGAAIERSEEKS